MPTETAGGYDDGYKAVPCFWGTSPSSLVSAYLNANNPAGLRVLDVGAGEGKNATAFSTRGAAVDALECSKEAVINGKRAFSETPINWITADARQYEFPVEYYDLIVCYGLVHCMQTEPDAASLIDRTKRSLKRGGTYILASFNNGSHDLSAHPEFKPLLLSHQWFLDIFSDWSIVEASDSLLHETHPHNGIPHHHSLTRLVAQRP